MSTCNHQAMTEAEVVELFNGIFGTTHQVPPDGTVPDNTEFEPVTNKVVEVRTPNSTTRFHAPNDRVEFEREKYEDAKHERQAQGFRVVFPNPRMR